MVAGMEPCSTSMVQYGITVILLASLSILQRAGASERIPGVALVSRKRWSWFSRPYWLDQRSDVPEQYLAVGWVGDRLYSVIFEVREDEEGEIEVRRYEENS